MENLKYQIVDSISKINRQSWESLFGDLPEGYQFYKTVEESHLPGFKFYYLLISSEGDVFFIAPLFVADFYLDIAVEGPLAKAISLMRKLWPRLLVLKTVFCGSPFGESAAFGIKKAASSQKLLAVIQEALSAFSRQAGAVLVMFKDLLKEDSVFLQPLVNRGFLKVDSFPSVTTKLAFGSFDEYLSSLGGSTRKSLRRKLKQAHASARIEIEVVEDAQEKLPEIFRLYENSYQAGKTKFEKLNPDFFRLAAKNMEGRAKFFLYYVNSRLAAFNLCFVYKDLFIDKFIGFDYDLSRQYSLYFLSWAYNVEWCIKHGILYYQTGQTDYGPKLRLGGKLVPLFVYLKHKNPLPNLILKFLALFLKPDNFEKVIGQ